MNSKCSGIFCIGMAMFGLAGCKAVNKQTSSNVLGSVARKENMVPEWVFHYGPRNLLKDNTVQTYTEKWSSLADNSQISLRQGLYVNQHPAYNEHYAMTDITKSEAESPWLVALRIKASCRIQDSVVKEVPEEIMKNPVFREWIKAPFNDSSGYASESEFSENCMKPEAFQPFQKDKGNATKCANTVANFYKKPKFHLGGEAGDGQIEAVRDSLGIKEGNWYLRSPNCIEQVRSGVSDFFAMAGEFPDFWAKAPYTDNFERQVSTSEMKFGSGDAQLYILLRALSESSTIDQVTINKIRQNSRSSDIPGIAGLIEKIVTKATKCTDTVQFQNEIKEYMNFAQTSTNLSPSKGGIEFVAFKQALDRQMSAACGAANQIAVIREEARQKVIQDENDRLQAEKNRQAQLEESQKQAALQTEKDRFQCKSNQRGPYYKNSRPDTGDCGNSGGIEEKFSDGSYGYCCYGRKSSSNSSNVDKNPGQGENVSDCMKKYPNCWSPKSMHWNGYSGQMGNCSCY